MYKSETLINQSVCLQDCVGGDAINALAVGVTMFDTSTRTGYQQKQMTVYKREESI